jgi:hypothetical protein
LFFLPLYRRWILSVGLERRSPLPPLPSPPPLLLRLSLSLLWSGGRPRWSFPRRSPLLLRLPPTISTPLLTPARGPCCSLLGEDGDLFWGDRGRGGGDLTQQEQETPGRFRLHWRLPSEEEAPSRPSNRIFFSKRAGPLFKGRPALGSITEGSVGVCPTPGMAQRVPPVVVGPGAGSAGSPPPTSCAAAAPLVPHAGVQEGVAVPSVSAPLRSLVA